MIACDQINISGGWVEITWYQNIHTYNHKVGENSFGWKSMEIQQY